MALSKPVKHTELNTARGEETMNQAYYDAVTKMEEMGVDPEYVQGWQGGFLLNPEREEQRVTEAYSAGYEDGKARNMDNFSNWAK
jgi:hypothetical protein